MDSKTLDKITQAFICFGVFILWHCISFIPIFFSNYKTLYQTGYIFPFMSLALWLPFSYVAIKKYALHYKDIKKGGIDIQSTMLFILFIFILRLVSVFYDKPEVWVESIISYSNFSFFCSLFAFVFWRQFMKKSYFAVFFLIHFFCGDLKQKFMG